jgi:tetratricopeptide (TPR) repeat protein
VGTGIYTQRKPEKTALYQEALSFWQKAMELNPGYTQAEVAINKLNFRTGRFKTTRNRKKGLPQATLNNLENLYNEGVVLYTVGKYLDALGKWNSVLKIDPGYTKAVNNVRRVKFLLRK